MFTSIDMTVALLVVLWLLTFVLGRIRQLQLWRFSRLIPSMVFFRVSITAALISRFLVIAGIQGDVVDWIRLVAKTGIYVAVVEIVLDLIWALSARFSLRGMAPPRILKDFSLIAASAIVVSAELRSQGLLTTVGSAAILGGLAFIVGPGSASQISNISSALTVQVERQFAVGDWVEIDGKQGRVDNVTWNSMYLYDDINDRIIVFPNSFIDSGKVINFSRPSDSQYRLTIEVGLSYDLPPGEAIALLRSVLDRHEGVLDPSRNVVAIRSFDESCISYLLKFFVDDFGLRNKVKTEIYSCIWYELERAGYSVPYPVIDLHTHHSTRRLHSERQQFIQSQSFELLRSIDLFESLSDEEINGIVCQDRALAFGPGEIIVDSGQVGGSMYVLLKGVCSVLIPDPSGGEHSVELSRLKRGMIFGEIAALTNAPRTASVRAIGHVMLQEISQQRIEDVFLKNETAMEAFAKVMTSREAADRSLSPDQQKSFELSLIDRMAQTFNKFFSK